MEIKLTMLLLIIGSIIGFSHHGGDTLIGRTRRLAVLHLRKRNWILPALAVLTALTMGAAGWAEAQQAVPSADGRGVTIPSLAPLVRSRVGDSEFSVRARHAPWRSSDDGSKQVRDGRVSLTSINRPGASGNIIDRDNSGFRGRSMRADQIMTRGVITVGPDTSIVEAANKMLSHHISALPVVSSAGELIGIVSEGDFIRRAEIGTQRRPGRWLQFLVSPGKAASDFVQAHGRKVREIMTPAPHTISEQTPLDEIVHIMETSHIKRLPVLRGNQLVGIVTPSNLLQAVADLARDVPEPTADDDQIRTGVIAAIGDAKWAPCRLSVMVRNGVASLGGIVTSDRSRLAAIVAAENVPGVRQVVDHLSKAPPPEECLGGGDFVSLQEQPSTTDDEPL